LKFLEQF